MANGIYGTSIPTLIDDNDITKYVDIYYSYSETRNSSDVNANNFQKLDSENLKNVIADTTSSNDTFVSGLYNLKLPSSIFGSKGFYTIYITPKEVSATIADVSTLRDYPNIRGIVLDTNSLSDDIKTNAQTNNGLVGYRIVYKNDDGTRSNEIRLVTSNNKCEPVVSTSTSTNSKSYTYQYNENSTYTFLTVSPSMPLSFKASSTPYIGKTTQEIYLVNTMFEPVCIELEMTDYDTDSIVDIMTASQLRNLEDGKITSFDENGNILVQYEMTTLKSTETGSPQYEVRENKRNNIDFSQTLTDKL